MHNEGSFPQFSQGIMHGNTSCSIVHMQVKVVGPKYGMWGLRKYGTTLKNIDCLEFWPDRLRCLSDLIQQQQEAAKKLAVPAAFVTFKSVLLLISAASDHTHLF